MNSAKHESMTCGVFVSVNEHRDVYQTATERLAELDTRESPPEMADEVRQKMIELDTIVCVQFYPVYPSSCYVIYHYDLNAALDEAIAALESDAQMRRDLAQRIGDARH